LVTGLLASESYAGVWENFAPTLFRQDPNIVLKLADQLLARFRTPQGARRSDPEGIVGPALPDAAFLAMWRYANRHIERGELSRDWLKRQVELAMPSSLALVNDLYYHWASANYGIVRPQDRAYIRRVILKLAREQLQIGEDLSRVTHPRFPYSTYQLVFPPDSDDGPSECRGLPDWDWIGPVVLDALRAEPARFALEAGYLISNSQRRDRSGFPNYQIDNSLLVGFFGSAAREVVNLLVIAKENFTGRNREILEQLVQSATVPPESALT
jgi:hypothetical protein